MLDVSGSCCPAQVVTRTEASQPQTGPGLDATPAMFFEEPRPSLEEEDRRKRSREAIEQESLESFLAGLGKEEQQQQASGGSGGAHGHALRQDHTAQSEDRRHRSNVAPVDAVAAARTKAGRERARRERLNER